MKKYLLPSLLVTALLISACDKQGVNDPIDPGTTSLQKAIDDFTMTNEQLCQVDEMFYMDEDMSVLLTTKQEQILNKIVNSVDPSLQDDRGNHRRRLAIDMQALIYYRLIVRANPDLSDEIKQALREAIKLSIETRIQIIKENKDNPELLKSRLRAEHERLISEMNLLLTPDQLANVKALIEKIEQYRKELREKWVEIRINRHVEVMTKYLGLSQEQATAVKTLLLNQHAQIQILREQYKGDPEGFRLALKGLKEATELELKEILTEEQWDKWTNRWKRGGGGPGGMMDHRK